MCTSCLATICNDLINGYGMKPMCNCKLHYGTMPLREVLTCHQRFSVAFSFVPGVSKLMFLALVCVIRKVVCVQALTIMLSNHDVRWTPACLPKCAFCTFFIYDNILYLLILQQKWSHLIIPNDLKKYHEL